MFPVKHFSIGYYCANFYISHGNDNYSDKDIKGYGITDNLITLYNLFNPIAYLHGSMLEIVSSRIITFLYIVSRETWI